MTRTWVCAALLLTVGLAGCMAEDKGQSGSGGALPPEPRVLPDALAWGLSGCQATIIFFDVPAEAVRPHLPEGFSPLPSAVGMAGASANPADGGSFGIEMFTCESGVGLNGTVAEMAYGSLFAFVSPPDDLVDPEADIHFVKWDVLVPDADRRAVLQALGVPAVNGTTTYATFTLTGSIGELEGSMELNGTYGFSGATYAPGPEAVTFVEFTAVPQGLVAFKTRATTTMSGLGTGTVTVPADGLAAEVLGSGAHDGTLMAFVGDFLDGSIRVVPRDA